MQPWRDVRAILALQSLSCKHPTAWNEHFPPQNHMLCPSVCMMSIYVPATHKCQCVKGNGCFTASDRCFLALICCHWFCSMHSRISFTCSVFCAGFHPSFICYQLFTSFLSSFLLCCRFTLCTWATTMVWLLLWPHGFISNFCQESLQSNIRSHFLN
jgi:hypothetical protein